jgi:signal transduction protein with GAF and PtsI domain
MVAPIAAIVAAARLARAAQVAARTAGGIKSASTVSKVYREGSAAPITRTQAQINEEGIAKARAALGTSKPDPKAVARRMTQDKAREMERIRNQGRNTR